MSSWVMLEWRWLLCTTSKTHLQLCTPDSLGVFGLLPQCTLSWGWPTIGWSDLCRCHMMVPCGHFPAHTVSFRFIHDCIFQRQWQVFFIAFCWACPIVPMSFRSLTPLPQLLGFPFSFVCLVNGILPKDHQLEPADQIWAQVGCYDFKTECELRSTHICQFLAASSWHEPGAVGLEHWFSPSRMKNLASCAWPGYWPSTSAPGCGARCIFLELGWCYNPPGCGWALLGLHTRNKLDPLQPREEGRTSYVALIMKFSPLCSMFHSSLHIILPFSHQPTSSSDLAELGRLLWH